MLDSRPKWVIITLQIILDNCTHQTSFHFCCIQSIDHQSVTKFYDRCPLSMKQRKFDPTLDVVKANIGSQDYYCETKPTKFYALTSYHILPSLSLNYHNLSSKRFDGQWGNRDYKCRGLRALSHIHVLTWRPEDVLGVHWKLPERGENAWFYPPTGFAATHRVVSGDLNTSALRHLTSLSRSNSVYPVLTTSWTRSYRVYRQVLAACLEFAPRLASATPLRLHSVLGVLTAYEGDQTRSDDALSQHVIFWSNFFFFFCIFHYKYLRSQRCHGWERKAWSEREREGKEHICTETSTKTKKRRCGFWVWRRIGFHYENFRITGLCNGNLLTAK